MKNTPTNSLLTKVSDITKSTFLEQMLDKTTSSYKFYWLMGILDEVCDGRTYIEYQRIVALMAANAWYPTNFFHLSLGTSDRLDSLTRYVQKAYGIGLNAKKYDVVCAIESNLGRDSQLQDTMRAFVKYVPLRLIRPFYETEVRLGQEALRASGTKRPDGHADKLIFQANACEPEKSMYRIVPDKEAIDVQDDWARFIRENEQILRGWLDFRLTQYLQARNPSVPAISMKLRPQEQRSLATATRYWKCAMELISLTDIYSHKEFTAENFKSMGALSINHFIPWSFVLHDEAWDLIPMFKDLNSSKSDGLPSIEQYLEPFCFQQFNAMLAVKDAGLQSRHREHFESLRSIDAHIDEYSDCDTSREAFSKSISDTIVPLYQIARNQGYQVVRYEGGVSYFVVDA